MAGGRRIVRLVGYARAAISSEMAWGDFADFANERENIDAILVCSGTLYMNNVELAISIFRCNTEDTNHTILYIYYKIIDDNKDEEGIIFKNVGDDSVKYKIIYNEDVSLYLIRWSMVDGRWSVIRGL